VLPLLVHDRCQLSEIGDSLYSGSSGVALFLAALHRVTGSSSARDLALCACQLLRERLNNPESRARLTKLSGVGGGAGLGAIVYSLVKTAEFLDDQGLITDARRYAELITSEAIARNRYVDVLQGSAGALLALLALHRVDPDRWILERALDCGYYILEKQVECEPAGRAWHSSSGKPLTGFSHGAAGIAYALLRLYAVVGDASLRTGAEAAIAYETAVYSPNKRNWPDFRDVEKQGNMPGYPCQWCHGASGIGLARLGGREILTDDQIERDIDVAIRVTREMPRVALDHLCCGNFGRLEFLFTAGRRLNQSDLMALARARAHETVAHARKAGGFNWRVGNDRYNPGFFTGLSGVGYTLLRFAHPDVLPSVMLWH
jgi:type 2 lantibiotic biosynthesis protein LanM